ncbi:MAG: ABC transporter permease [Peptostreptococcaceae bacterium]|nr:ABC transporter permease [Peptostreptococcaceae bacterium]
MAGFKAVIYKDLKLFLRGMGWIAWILPFVLMLLMQFGMKDLSAEHFVQAFPIAILDQDSSFMSRSMISQIREVELFSDVHILSDPKEVQKALEDGFVAVVTIPKDFFYDAYAYRKNPIHVLLQNDHSVESRIFRSIFTSIMDVMRNDQAIALGVYRFSYADSLNTKQRQDLIRESGSKLLQNILARQQEFDAEAVASDLRLSLVHKISATILTLLAMLMAFHSVKTIPDEIRLGVLPRFHAIGGSRILFVFSKLICALIFSLPTILLVLVAYHQVRPLIPIHAVAIFALYLLLLFAMFVLIMIFILTMDATIAQQIANAFILISLLIGGTIIPANDFSKPLEQLSRWSIFHFALVGLESIERKLPTAQLLLPLFIQIAFFSAISLILGKNLLHRRKISIRAFQKTSEKNQGPAIQTVQMSEKKGSKDPFGNPKPHFVSKLCSLTLFKIYASVHGKIGLCLLLILSLLIGGMLQETKQRTSSTLHLMIVDADESSLSENLILALEQHEALSIEQADPKTSSIALVTGRAEGLLTIPKGFGEMLQNNERSGLHYEGASASLSAQGVREIIASNVLYLKSRLHAETWAKEKVGHPLSDEEKQLLQEKIDSSMKYFRQLYTIESADHQAPKEIFVPDPIAFITLAVLLTLLTISGFFGSIGSRRVTKRMRMLPQGHLLSYGSDFASLAVLGIWIFTMILITSGEFSLKNLLAGISYSLCIAAMIRLLLQNSREGRVDTTAPFIALMICLWGGCFIDLNELSPALRYLMILSPAGQAIAATQDTSFDLLLLLEAAVLFVIGSKDFIFKKSAR